MAAQKRLSSLSFSDESVSTSSSSSSTHSSSSKKSKRQVSMHTFEKWQREYDRRHQTLTWLKCDHKNDLVTLLWCSACRQYQDKVCSMKNFTGAWVTGSENQRTSNLLDHASSDQHKAAMAQLRAAQARASDLPVASYSPVMRGLLTIDDAEQMKLRKKFDMAYFLAKEGIAFEKFPALCSLESRHEVEIGHSYRTAPSAQQFTHFIAEAQRQQYMEDIMQKRFYSFLMDGSTDSGNVEQELVILVSFRKDDNVQAIRSHSRFFSVLPPKSANATGLINCLNDSLVPITGDKSITESQTLLGDDYKPAMVGGGTDGASVNIGEQNGMKGIMEASGPWLMWSWCFAHRLELACKNAFENPAFKEVEEMLLRLYYLYEKSPKKVRELKDVVNDLKEVFEYPDGGDLPIRSHGSRWIAHKRNALLRVIDRYGAYITHLVTLSQDETIKGDDRAKLKGYIRKWTQYKVILSCALYSDILKSPSLLSQSLQGSEVDIVLGLKNILKSVVTLNGLSKSNPLEWPTVKLVEGRIKDENGEKTYQGAQIKNCSCAVKKRITDAALNNLKVLEEKLKERLSWSNTKLLRALLVFTETQAWMKRSTGITSTESFIFDDEEDLSMKEIKEAVEIISNHFRAPLEAKGVSIASLPDELEDAVEYARSYLNICEVEYRKVWYKLFTCPDAKKWPNVLILCELSFSLPFTNGRVEQIFSSLKYVKNIRRTRLNVDTLNDLMEIYVEGPPMNSFSPESAIKLWWKKTTRRIDQSSRRKDYHRANKDNTLESEETEDTLVIDIWDDFFTTENADFD